MLGIIIILGFSWALLYRTKKGNLNVLGFHPVTKRLKELLIGFLLSSVICALTQVIEAGLKDTTWVLNTEANLKLVVIGFWWDFKSVLTEELVFRGAFLYLLIEKVGHRKALVISSICFGIYHWFSMNLFGNVTAMLIIFIGTGLMGCAWAWAFAKTKSIFLPFGLHLGWNFSLNTVFSKGPLGEMLLTLSDKSELEGWPSLINFLIWFALVPALVLLFIRFAVKEEHKS